MGAANGNMLSRGVSGGTLLDTESSPRVRIPVFMQAWNEAGTRPTKKANQRQPKIAAKPLSHVLRARLERPNDFYISDWRLQTTPIRWLKQSNQYQVRLEVFRRYGEAGQVEESLGTLTLSGVLQKQSDGLFVIQGSTRHRFNDNHGQPILEIEAGTPIQEDKTPLISKSKTDLSL